MSLARVKNARASTPGGSSGTQLAVCRPAAAQHLVQRDQVLQLRGLRLTTPCCDLEQRALRVQHVEVARRAVLVAQVGQAEARFLGLRLRTLRAQLFAQRGAAGQRVGDFAEGRLDRAFVLRHGDVAVRLATSRLAWLAPPSKIGSMICGANGQARSAEQAEQVVAGHADAAGQRDAREEGRARRADVGVGGVQLLLGLADVGPALRAARTAGRPAARPAGPGRPAAGRRQVGRQRAGRPAAPARSRPARAGAAARRSAARAPSTSDPRLREVELRGDAVVELQLQQLVALLARASVLRVTSSSSSSASSVR